jgi:serine phosphatase RsbU (regulator of sigma subunit)
MNMLPQGSRFTHWTIGGKLTAPLFTINGIEFWPNTVASLGLLLAIIYAVYRYSREEMQRRQAIQQELRSAQELQQVLIPEELPSLPGFALTSSYRPAQEVGGDFFQIIPLDTKSAIIVIGDVSGKGLRAAMAVALIVGAVRTLAESTASPAEILAGLSRRLHGRLRGGFATCVAMRLDADGSCTIAAAGHPAPYLNGREIELAGTLPLGINPDVVYAETTMQLQPTDYMVLYTDGLPEARTTAGELFSFARVSELLATKPDAARATEAAVSFGQEDDITVLTLTRLGVGEESRTRLIAPVLVPA